MMGRKEEAQAALFYEFSREDHVPQDYLLRLIDRFVAAEQYPRVSRYAG